MREVQVLGVGMTAFGKFLDRGLKALGGEAICAALADAGVEADELQAAFVGNAMAGLITGQECIRGQVILRALGDDYPMTSLSDGLGPQKDPNSGRTRVQSGPAGTHRPTTRRGSGIAQPSVPRARCPECLARRGCGPARAIVTPDAPPAIAARGSACP